MDIFRLNLQLFNLMPPDHEGINPLLMDDEPEAPEVDEVPIDATPGEEQPPQVGQPPTGQVEQPRQGEDPLPGEDIHAYLERMREDILSRLPQEEAPPEEDLEAKNQEWLERFYENPMQQVQELAEQIAAEKIKPFMAEREARQKMEKINAEIAAFKQNHPDMDIYINDMVQIFQEMPEIENTPHALDVAYRMAKGNRFDSVPKSLDGYLTDDAAIDQLLGNEQIRGKLVQKLMADKKKAPPVMGTSGTKGAAPMAEGNEITDLKQATRAWLNHDES